MTFENYVLHINIKDIGDNIIILFSYFINIQSGQRSLQIGKEEKGTGVHIISLMAEFGVTIMSS